MIRKTRVIPVLLLRGRALVKTVKFKAPAYIGDPVNSVRIFNEKEVDELVFLDISASREGRGPDFDLLADIASEAFMPMAYGGGITTVDQIRAVLSLGFEKVVINTSTFSGTALIAEASAMFGSQSIVACVDARRTIFGGYNIYSTGGKIKQSVVLTTHVKDLERCGAGELIINSIDRDGTQSGYDLDLIRLVTTSVQIPVVASGGAGGLYDFTAAVHEAGAAAVAAGSLFVYFGRHRSVLINYPSNAELSLALP